MCAILLQINWQDIETRIGGERVSNFLWCIGIIITTLLLKKPLSNLIARASATIANRFSEGEHQVLFRTLIRKPVEWLIETILYYIAINQLQILLSQYVLHRYEGTVSEWSIRVGDIADHIFLFFLILFTTLVFVRIADFVLQVLMFKARSENNQDREQLLPLIREIIKLALWAICFFAILGTVFHVNIPALITGLGIGGIALALAAKETVENFFAAFTILADKPFQTEDVIKLGTLEGTVEKIGFRSTRLRSTNGSVYIIPNRKLVTENLENLTQRDVSRQLLVLTLKYSLAPEKLRSMSEEVKQMIKNTLHVKEPVGIIVENFGEASFQLKFSYHLPYPLKDESTVKQEINMKVYEIVNRYTSEKAITDIKHENEQ